MDYLVEQRTGNQILNDITQLFTWTQNLIGLDKGELLLKWSFLSGLFGLVVAIIGVYYARASVRQSTKLEEVQQVRFGFTYIDREECGIALQHYIEPDCSSVDPSCEDDLRALIPSRQSVRHFFEGVLSPQSKYKHIIVLAETGMGKTSLLYNLLWQNYKLRPSKRRQILYIPLGRPGVLDKISGVKDKTETILLLDAFDEDTEAILDHHERMVSLMKAAGDFKRVVITCRTQFFTRDEEIPKESGVVKIAPREAGDAGVYLIYKTYLAPFDRAQIKKWIRKRFGILRVFARYQASSLIEKIPELAVRPFLLTALPDLIRDREKVDNIFELYGYMLKKWFEREARWIEPSKLEEFSHNVAVDIYVNREKRKAERLPFEELQQHFNVSVPADGWKFKSRSLLNRDSEGNFKFAHRSIMEYVFVDAYLRGNLKCLEVPWTEFMVELFWKAVLSSQNNRGNVEGMRESIFISEDLRTAGILREGLRIGSLRDWDSDLSMNKPSFSDQYSGLFIRIGVVNDTLIICDLLKNRVYAFLIGNASEDSKVFAVNRVEAESLASKWSQGNHFGISGWQIVPDNELKRLFRFPSIRNRFGAFGIRLWVRLNGNNLAVLNIDGQGVQDEIVQIPTWKDRLNSNPSARNVDISAVMVQVVDADAEAFYFRSMRQGYD
ncbi:NACHT domain-containing protein [Limnobacter profundi]|uniref:NACHT domain-containing protein n=1 Tax=Limnobacter profundi TaxID=2732163 RepID=UPI00197D36CA|nr:hypothetical protein [Limnobacter sp. SAORIC-580]